MFEKIDGEESGRRVLLVGVFQTGDASGGDELQFERSMQELDALVSACNMLPVGRVTQQLPKLNNACYAGTGKLAEIRERLSALDADLCVVNDGLSPVQLKNLQKEIGAEVMDRTMLILRIFSRRARSREAKLQVELAQVQYLKPRLIGMWEKQNRQGGGSGAISSKGEGETQLELDRRQIDHRLSELRKELKEVEKERETQRKKRNSSSLPLVSLIGYTNAGKSAIMNAMLSRFNVAQTETGEKKVFEENMLFATLDTSVRRISPSDRPDFMLSDTVGFVNKLPTALVEAFRSTLEDLKEADLLLHVVDCSDPGRQEQMEVTERMIRELGAGHIPVIHVYNKADLVYAEDRNAPEAVYPRQGAEKRDAEGLIHKSIYMCAKDGASIEMLTEMITEELFGRWQEEAFLIPYTQGAAAEFLRKNAVTEHAEYQAEGTLLKVLCTETVREQMKQYLHCAQES